jgi:hypothetical protein
MSNIFLRSTQPIETIGEKGEQAGFKLWKNQGIADFMALAEETRP